MLKKTSRWAARFLIAFGILIILCCILLIHKEHETLSRLIHPESGPMSTDVYSRWLDLKTGGLCSPHRVLAWLDMLGYQRMPTKPTQPGQYYADSSSLTIFTRSFHYPDGDYPAQLFELEFSGNQLREMKTFAGHAILPTWRLEPTRLVE